VSNILIVSQMYRWAGLWNSPILSGFAVCENCRISQSYLWFFQEMNWCQNMLMRHFIYSYII